MELVTRQRVAPRIYDFCYFTCKNNLKGLKYLRTSAGKNRKNGTKLKILDVGCGVKPFEHFFSNSEYTGIDFTKEKTKADKIVDLNKEKIPFKENTFDIVIVSETMEHVFNNANLSAEIKRVTKKGGLLFISTPFQFHLHGDPHDYYRFTKYYYKKMFSDMNLLSYSESNSILSTPFFAANVIFEPIPILSYPLLVLNNILIFAAEFISKILKIIFYRQKTIINYINGSPVGYYFIFRK